MNPLKKLASQTAVYGLSSIVGRFLNYLLVPLHTRIFDKADFGVVTELYAYVTFLIILLTYGMETSFFNFSRKENNSPAVYSTALISLLTSSLTFMLMFCMFSGPIAQLLNYTDHPEYVIYFSLIIGLDAITAVPFARLRQQNKATQFALIKLVGIGVNILLNILFLLIFPKWGYYSEQVGVGYIFIANLASSIFVLLLLLPQFNIKPEFDKSLWKKMMRYGFPILLAGLPGMVNETLDRVVMKYLLPEGADKLASLGVYGACYKLSMLMTIFIQAYRFAAEPFFFSEKSDDAVRKNLARSTHYFAIVCLLIFLGIVFYIDIVKLFIDERYYEGLSIVPILLFANFCLGLYINLSMWFKLSQKTIFGIYFSLFGAVITVLLNLILIPKIGYAGGAWATLACYVSMLVLCYLIGQKYFPVHYDVFSFGLYVVMALILYFVSNYLHLNMFVNTFLLLLFVGVVILKERKLLRHKNI